MAILEGMAASRPWIGTPVGAVPTVIRDEINGILVPPENAKLLAESMSRLMRDPEDRARMAAAARLITEQEFSAQRMSEDHLHLYTVATIQAPDSGGNRWRP